MKLTFTILGVFVLVLVAATETSAQSNPFTGTWKMNAAKTKIKAVAPLKDDTVTITTANGEDVIEGDGTATDGSLTHRKFAAPVKGGTGKFLLAGPYDGVSVKVPNENTRDVTETKAGKEALHFTAVVSKDGKTMTVTVKGVDAQGKPLSGVAVYEKQ